MGVRLCGSRGTYARPASGGRDRGLRRARGGRDARLRVGPGHERARPPRRGGPFRLRDRSEGTASPRHRPGHVNRSLVQAFGGCDAVLIESNYDPGLLRDGPYPWSLKERILGGRATSRTATWGASWPKVSGGLPHGGAGSSVANNNHPELAQMTAEESLGGRGRRQRSPHPDRSRGTSWIEVSRPARARQEAGSAATVLTVRTASLQRFSRSRPSPEQIIPRAPRSVRPARFLFRPPIA